MFSLNEGAGGWDCIAAISANQIYKVSQVWDLSAADATVDIYINGTLTNNDLTTFNTHDSISNFYFTFFRNAGGTGGVMYDDICIQNMTKKDGCYWEVASAPPTTPDSVNITYNATVYETLNSTFIIEMGFNSSTANLTYDHKTFAGNRTYISGGGANKTIFSVSIQINL